MHPVETIGKGIYFSGGNLGRAKVFDTHPGALADFLFTFFKFIIERGADTRGWGWGGGVNLFKFKCAPFVAFFLFFFLSRGAGGVGGIHSSSDELLVFEFVF